LAAKEFQDLKGKLVFYHCLSRVPPNLPPPEPNNERIFTGQ